MALKSGYKCLNIQRLAIRFVSYEFGIRLMQVVFGWQWLHTTWFRKKWVLFSKLKVVCPMEHPHDEFKIFLCRSYFRVWIVGAFSKLADSTFDRIVRVEGFDILKENIHSERGVLLLSSNVGFGRLLAGVLARKNIDFLSLDGGGLMDAAGVSDVADIKILGKGGGFLLRQLFEADKTLKKGGMVHSTGDGSEGSHSSYRLFLGYKRRFQTSLLELAVKRDAIVIPVFVLFESVNCIRVKFHAPLGDQEGDAAAHILDGYVAHLEKYWLQCPGQIAFGQINKLLKEEKGIEGDVR